MQRWKLYAGLALVFMTSLAGGGYYGYKEYKLSRPAPIWVPLVIRSDVPVEKQEAIVEQIKQELKNEDLLKQVVIDAKLQQGFNLPSEKAAIAELKKRLFVKLSKNVKPTGIVHTIDVGLDGTRREEAVLKAATLRINKDVLRICGIDPETGRPMQNQTPTLSPGAF